MNSNRSRRLSAERHDDFQLPWLLAGTHGELRYVCNPSAVLDHWDNGSTMVLQCFYNGSTRVLDGLVPLHLVRPKAVLLRRRGAPLRVAILVR